MCNEFNDFKPGRKPTYFLIKHNVYLELSKFNELKNNCVTSDKCPLFVSHLFKSM